MGMMLHAVKRRPLAVALSTVLALGAASLLGGSARGAGGGDKAPSAGAPVKPQTPPAPEEGERKMLRPPTDAQPPAAPDPKVPFEKLTLDNGLEVILIQDNRTPVVFVSVWYHVGSGDETVGKSGFAHLFEHMMFQGTKNTGEDKHFEILKSIGVSNVNGTTNTDRTNYFEQVPSNQLETALWLESERMGYLLPEVTDKSLANQIDVVRNERRQSYDNRPYGLAGLAMIEALYPAGHPYKYSVIGRHEDLAAASATDVKNFFKKWYVPANATLTIAGDFDPAQAKALVTKWFGGFPKATKPAHVSVPMPTITSKRWVVEDKLAKLRKVHYAWHSPAMFAPGDAELGILASALGSSTGRLYRALVVDRSLARRVSVSQGSAQLSSTFEIEVELNPDADLAEVEKIIDAEVERVTKEPISERELTRVVTQLEASFVWGLEPVSRRAEVLQRYNHYLGNPDSITVDLDRYRKTTTAKVQETAAAFLKKTNRLVMIVMPAGGK
jgi:predicted Zn-dependent peptidase